MCCCLYNIRNRKLLITWVNNSCMKPPPPCTRTCFFVLKGTLGSASLTKVFCTASNFAYLLWTMVCFPWELFKCICCGVAILRRNWHWWEVQAQECKKTSTVLHKLLVENDTGGGGGQNNLCCSYPWRPKKEVKKEEKSPWGQHLTRQFQRVVLALIGATKLLFFAPNQRAAETRSRFMCSYTYRYRKSQFLAMFVWLVCWSLVDRGEKLQSQI